MNLNKVHLVGRVGSLPELKNTSNGSMVAKFTLATNQVYKDKNGERKESSQFHNIVVWGKLAKIVQEYAVKGQEMCVIGRIEYRSWEKQDGTKGYITEIVLEEMQLGSKPRNDRKQATEEPPVEANESVPINASDVPF